MSSFAQCADAWRRHDMAGATNKTTTRNRSRQAGCYKLTLVDSLLGRLAKLIDIHLCRALVSLFSFSSSRVFPAQLQKRRRKKGRSDGESKSIKSVSRSRSAHATPVRRSSRPSRIAIATSLYRRRPQWARGAHRFWGFCSPPPLAKGGPLWRGLWGNIVGARRARRDGGGRRSVVEEVSSPKKPGARKRNWSLGMSCGTAPREARPRNAPADAVPATLSRHWTGAVQLVIYVNAIAPFDDKTPFLTLR